MKNSKAFSIIFIVLMIFFTDKIIAHTKTNNDTLKLVTASLIKKYPDAKIKSWKVKNGEYTAKIIKNDRKCFATFDKNGFWIRTASKISWTQKLPDVVEAAFKKSKYYRYHVFFMKDVETPAGHYYQIMVDDSNHKVDALHQGVTTKNWLVEFDSNGAFKHAEQIENSQDYVSF